MKINVFPNVPITSAKLKSLTVWGWQFPESRLGEIVTINGNSVKKLLTLDVNIPDASFASIVNNSPLGELAEKALRKNYPCIHQCPGCFNEATLSNPIMTYEEVMYVIDQAIPLGLESIKFLGPGELLMNPNLFKILDGFKERNIIVGIFTKGALLGSDPLALIYQQMDSQELVNRLTAYDNITFLIGGRSFVPEIENKYVPTKSSSLRNQFDYHASRNLAIERLCSAGMNNDPDKLRLAVIASPVGPETIGEIFEMFTWCIERNIVPFITVSMISGKGHGMVKRQQNTEFIKQYEDVAVKIYSYLIEQGITTIGRLRHEGISSYVGITPCNQLTHGLYIHYDGEVWRCPGNDMQEFVVAPNVRVTKLLDIWQNSINYRISKFNNRCVKDGITIPKDFYRNVLRRIAS